MFVEAGSISEYPDKINDKPISESVVAKILIFVFMTSKFLLVSDAFVRFCCAHNARNAIKFQLTPNNFSRFFSEDNRAIFSPKHTANHDEKRHLHSKTHHQKMSEQNIFRNVFILYY